jgi:hypothetical protein
MAREELTPVLAATGIGFGAAAVLAPRTLARVYGLDGDGDAAAVMQLFGTRNVALGVLALRADSTEVRESIAGAVGIVCAVDTVNSVLNGLRGRISARSAAMTALTTASVAALCAYYVSD